MEHWKERKALLTGTLGDSFSAGDVLLEIETDKASMDVEAQDDGVMVKIMVHWESSQKELQELTIKATGWL